MATETAAVDARPPARRWGPRVVVVLLIAVALPLGVSILYGYSPTEYTFYPPCLSRLLLGLHCPGCGMTRCVSALLHGNVAQAFAYNPLFVVVLPLLAYAAGSFLYEAWTGVRTPLVSLPTWAVIVIVTLLVAFAVARNIDVYPLNLLAPHEI
jgi:hypothetical protein